MLCSHCDVITNCHKNVPKFQTLVCVLEQLLVQGNLRGVTCSTLKTCCNIVPPKCASQDIYSQIEQQVFHYQTIHKEGSHSPGRYIGPKQNIISAKANIQLDSLFITVKICEKVSYHQERESL